ncbi:integrase [Bradyrhizobium sp. LA6.1]|uniref:site-specific integrase n=1 Tax=Bradyrhizobium sp. LA6.1 TaxID=3156378 RepID=UPI003391E1BC
MSVERMKDKPHGKPRKLPWRYRDRSAGVVRYFKTQKEALEFQEENNANKRRTGLGLPTTVKDLQKYTVRDIIRSYMHFGDRLITEDDAVYDDKEELEEDSLRPSNVFQVLWKFSLRDICSMSLFEFNRQVADKYIGDRTKETWKPPGSAGDGKLVTPSTVRWEVSHIQLAWKAAKKWPGLAQLQNPWEGIRIKGSTGGRRERGLEEDELKRLLAAADRCLGENRYYVRLAILLAAHTAMRRQEIFNLTWDDIDFKKRRITIRKSKTDRATGNVGKPVRIVLPVMAELMLLQLWASLYHDGHLPGPERMPSPLATPGTPPTGKIFPKTKDAVSQSIKDAAIRAGVEDFQFSKDLRRTANTMFIQAKLTLEERKLMRRETDKGMDAVYIGRETLLKDIQDKLDKHFLGQTELEAFNERKTRWLNYVERGLKDGLQQDEAIQVANALFTDWESDLLASVSSRQAEEGLSEAAAEA